MLLLSFQKTCFFQRREEVRSSITNCVLYINFHLFGPLSLILIIFIFTKYQRDKLIFQKTDKKWWWWTFSPELSYDKNYSPLLHYSYFFKVWTPVHYVLDIIKRLLITLYATWPFLNELILVNQYIYILNYKNCYRLNH